MCVAERVDYHALQDREFSKLPSVETTTDLRSSMVEVRDQGERPWCLIYSGSDVHANLQSLRDPLSVQYLAYFAAANSGKDLATSGFSMADLENTLKVEGQPLEQEAPVESDITVCEVSTIYKATCNSSIHSFECVIDLVRSGYPVLLALRINDGFLQVSSPYVISDDSTFRGNHAVIAVGVGRDENDKGLLMLRNSWGSGWGQSGHAWITKGYFEGRIICTSTMSAPNASN